MRVIVVGATGKTGRHVLRAGIEAGYAMTAFGRSAAAVPADIPGVEAWAGDALDGAAVRDAVEGHDAVVVCIGPTGLRDATTLTDGTRNVIAAMQANGCERLVVLSAAGTGSSWRLIPFSSKVLFRTMLRRVLAEHEAQEAMVESSGLEWTIVRAAVLKATDPTGEVLAGPTQPTTKITRGDVGEFLVAQLDDTTWLRQAVAITNP